MKRLLNSKLQRHAGLTGCRLPFDKAKEDFERSRQRTASNVTRKRIRPLPFWAKSPGQRVPVQRLSALRAVALTKFVAALTNKIQNEQNDVALLNVNVEWAYGLRPRGAMSKLGLSLARRALLTFEGAGPRFGITVVMIFVTAVSPLLALCLTG